MARKKHMVGSVRRGFRRIKGKRKFVEITKLTRGEKVKEINTGKIYYDLNPREYSSLKRAHIYNVDGKDKALLYDGGREMLADVLVSGNIKKR